MNKLLLLLAASTVLVLGVAQQPPKRSAPARSAPVAQRPQTLGEAPDFNRDVKPILSEHCFKCHGPDSGTLAAGLRLDTFEGATKLRGEHRAIDPGQPDKSRLIKRVSQTNEDLRMPPASSGMAPLSAQQIETLRRWIAAGARYDDHWSFVPPAKPSLPKVRNEAWVKNEIDRFVLARLEAEGMQPEPEADRLTLARRAFLTLTGLPPTPEEVEAFRNDRAPGAYERMIDRLLASKAYGVHQARYWMDAIRYGDTHGLHLDNERSIWPYRDWLVNALNDDLPFDQFTIWQLAGDMLPNPTVEQLVATGYVRMNPTTNEGGAIEEEFLVKNTFDRTDTTASVFLGLTVGCAKCHDHKYDPISQKDYYRMFAYFNSTADNPLDGNELAPAPIVRAATPEQQRQLQAMDSEMEQIRSSVSVAGALDWLKNRWEPQLTARGWQVSPVYEAADFEKAFATEYAPEKDEGVEWKAFDFKIGQVATPVMGKQNASAYVRGVIHSPEDLERELRVASDDGVRVWIGGKLVHSNKVLRGVGPEDTFKVKLAKGDNPILIKVVNSGGGDGLVLRLTDAVSERVDRFHKLWTEGKPADRKPEELKVLFLEVGPESDPAKRYRALQKQKAELEALIPPTLIARELPKLRPAYVLRRGEYNLRAERVNRGLPAKLKTSGVKDPADRLGLAKWLVSDKNPLVGRVFVNRTWQQHFGVGIVRTPDDFGSQGEWPVNRPLLDYLAVRFREDGWSMKKLHRLIVTSAAFRQRTAGVSKAKLERDPENRLASRGPRYRLDAEVIRDASLAASGLLNPQIGGKGFKPYQPEGLWEAIAFTESTTARYMPDKGPTIYRRSLYMFWKRTSPHPVMMSFDAPMRESCIVRRSRTNTPLQALVTLNETMFFESARVLAERIMREADTDNARFERAFALCFGRAPRPQETAVLGASLIRYRWSYRQDGKAAEKVVSVGDAPRDKSLPLHEHAAWTLICNTLMNTDEFLTQH